MDNQLNNLDSKNLEAKEIRDWAALCHLSALSGFLIPFGHILGPLIVWLFKRETSPLIDEQGKESLNFQITLSIAYLIAFLLVFFIIGVPLIFIIGIYGIIMVIMATIKTHEGKGFRYPYTWRVIK